MYPFVALAFPFNCSGREAQVGVTPLQPSLIKVGAPRKMTTCMFPADGYNGYTSDQRGKEKKAFMQQKDSLLLAP